MATIQSTNPFLPGISLPTLPSLSSSAPTPAVAKTVTPTIPNLGLSTNNSGSTTATAGITMPKISPALPVSTPASPFASFGAPGVNLSNGGSTTPALPQIVPATTPAAMAPNVKTNSGATVNPSTGAVVTPATPTTSFSSGAGATSPSSNRTSSNGFASSGLPNNVVKNADGSYTITNADGTTTQVGGQSSVSGAEDALKSASQLSPAEIAAMQGLQALNTSYATAYTNTEDQAIPLDFITGQQKVLADREAQLAAPLQAQQQIEESKRQANLEAAKTVLGTAQQQNTPITISPGSTAITPANPTTSLGTSGGLTAKDTQNMQTSPTAPYGKSFDSGSTLDIATQQYMSTGQMPSNPVYAGMVSQIQARANQLSQQAGLGPFNPGARQAQVQAATSTLTTQQQTLSNSSSALQTLQKNSKLLLDGLQSDGLNSSQAPIFNQIQQAWESLGLNPADQNSAADVAQFTNSLTTLQSEYAKLLAGAGTPTEGGTNRASEALPAGISVSGLAQLFNRIISEGNNKVDSINTQINTLNKQLNPYDFSSSGGAGSSGSSGSGSSIYNF